ncbi:hypothetical protein BX616_009531, partial [Lobosporangium transversale]
VKTNNTANLDQPILPIKSAIAKFYGHDHMQSREEYQDHLPYRQNASSAPSDKYHSRINIANLLCSEGTAADNGHHRQQQLRAITEEENPDHQRSRTQRQYHSSYNHGHNVARDNHYGVNGDDHGDGSYPSTTLKDKSHEQPSDRNGREPAFAHRASDSANPSSFRPSYPDRYSHAHSDNNRPTSSSAASPPESSMRHYPSSSIPYSTTPRSTHPGPQQRSASWNNDRYQDYSYSYEQDHHRKPDRSKSDYALHQQNYGPYSAPSSPPSSTAFHHSKPRSSETFNSSSSSSSSTPVSTKPAIPVEESSSLYFHASQSSTPSYNYSSSNSALLSAAENKPPRVYGRDSTVDDNWSPQPRTTRVVPIDAPNENWPYTYSGSSMLPPPYPSSSSVSKSTSSPSLVSSSTSHLRYPSNYSNTPVESKPRRIYGIDAADIPQRLPPPSHSASYRSSQYSKPLQGIPDEPEGEETRKRPMGQEADGYSRHHVSSMAAAYGSQAYGYSTGSSHHYPSSDIDRPRYDYENRRWKASSNHGASSTSSSLYSQSRPYSRPQSPNFDIKPPSWYQSYAHSVPPPPPKHQDYYQGHTQHHKSAAYNGYSTPSDLSAEHNHEHGHDDSHGDHSSPLRRASKSVVAASQSVHPFDTAEPKSSKSKKPKRIKNPGHDEDLIVMDDEFYAVKAKRKRANASQLSVLNAAFERSYFPSTEERLRLSKQCRMCPRTVQIWFQNKRQSVKAKTEAMEAAMAAGEGRRDSSGGESGEKGEDGEGPLATRRHHSNNRRSSATIMTPSEAVMSALHIQLDGRSVDYFSRKRRATIAKMEQNEQQKQQKQYQQEQEPQTQQSSQQDEEEDQQ